MKKPMSDELEATDVYQVPEFTVWSSPYINDLVITETSFHVMCHPEHVHDALEIIWIKSGAGTVEHRAQVIQLTAGQAAIIPSRQPHSGKSPQGFAYSSIQIPQDIFYSVVGLNELPLSSLPFTVISGPQVDRLLSRFVKQSVASNSFVQQMGLIEQLSCEVLNTFSRQKIDSLPVFVHPAIKHSIEVIAANFIDGVSLPQLAEQVKLDERYFISLFKAQAGIPPNQFQIALRVDLARKLIQGHVPLSAAAIDAGFADQSHLNRHFKRHYGMTPGTLKGGSQTVS